MNHNLFLLRLFAHQLNALQRAPLADRREAKAEWLDAMRHEPQLVAERVRWLLDGCYGEEAYTAARQVMNSPRANAVAWLAIAIAAHEWDCAPREARAAWRALTAEERERVDGAIHAVIDEAGARRRRNPRRD
jgi:hypothetical protein